MSTGERLRLQRRVRRLRRVHESQLRDLAGLTVQLRRLDSPKYEELAAERADTAAKTDEELIALERQLSPDSVGGSCPNCGLHSKRTHFCLRCGEKLPGRHRPDALTLPGAIVAIVAIAAAWLLGGVNLGTENSSSQNVQQQTRAPAAPHRPKYKYIVATAKRTQMGVYQTPNSRTPFARLDNPNLDGAPLAFLVQKTFGKWAKVYLPTRPNGSSGWIRLSGVKLEGHSYRVEIDLDSHRLLAWKGGRLILRTPVGVGRAVTPTPSGLYYITELLKQPDPTGIYGPYAFGLSAHSNVLHEFAGRDGILGLHGTNYPQGIGTDVSHGCIRMSNRAIIKLARTLPVGTPVRIRRV